MSCPHGNWGDCESCAQLDGVFQQLAKLQEQNTALLAREKLLEGALDKAQLLLAGWRTTWEEGRHANSPINSTRDWLESYAALRPSGEGEK